MSNNFNFNDYIVTETLNSQTAEFVGIEVNPVESQTKIPVIYGFRRTEPVRVLTSLNPRNTNELVCVFAISEGYCKGIHKIYIDGNDSGLSSTDLVHRTIVSPTTGAYAGIFTAEFIDGRDGTAATNTLNVGPSQLALQVLNQIVEYTSLSYLVCTFRYSVGGPYKQLPKVSVDFFGRYIMDAITLSPPGFTTAYRNNPVSVIVDLLTNQQYGAGIAVSKIDLDTIINTNYFPSDSTRYQPAEPIRTVNWICNTDAELRTNIELILETYGLILTYSNGKYVIVGEMTPDAGPTLDENSIIGSINVQYPNQSTKFNRCTVEYIDPANNFQSNTISWPPDGTVYNDYLLDDAGIVLENRISANTIIRRTEAGDLAQMIVRRSRDQNYYTFRATKEIYKYKVGDVLTIDLDYPPIFDTVIITELSMNSDFTFEVEAASWRLGFYPINFGANYSVTTRPPSLIPGSIGVQQPTGPGVPNPPPAPTFTVSSDKLTVNEGQTFTITITSSTVLVSETVLYDITGTNITGTDFDPPEANLTNLLQFSNSNTVSLTLTLARDGLTEGFENMTFTARLQSTRQVIGSTTITFIDSVAVQPPNPYWLTITTAPTGTQVPTFLKYPPSTFGGLGSTPNNTDYYVGPLNAAKTGVPTSLVNSQGIGVRVVSRTVGSRRHALLQVTFDLVDRLDNSRDTNRLIFCTYGQFSGIVQSPFGYLIRNRGGNTVYRYDPSTPVYSDDRRQSQKNSPSPIGRGEILTGLLPSRGIILPRTEPGVYSNGGAAGGAPLNFVINAGYSLTNSNNTTVRNCLGIIGIASGITLTFKFFELLNLPNAQPIEIGHARYSFNLTNTALFSPGSLIDSRAAYLSGTGLTAAF